MLGFDHPEGKGRLRFVSSLPADLLVVLERIRP
jgi:hypothetical protein